MDIYKLKFTSLQHEILRFLFIKSGMSFNARAISKSLKVSPTAVGKSLQALQENGLVKVTKDMGSKHLSIELNKDNPQVFNMKRVDNLKMIYESNLVDFLYNSFPGTTIVLFGSYSYGEDTIKSDVDIAIIGSKTKEIDLTTFEKILERKISINFYKDFGGINNSLKENICNGIILSGGIQL
jgi:predicted nucleotidyltransferase